MRRWTRREEGYVARTPVCRGKTGVSATLEGNVAWDVAWRVEHRGSHWEELSRKLIEDEIVWVRP